MRIRPIYNLVILVLLFSFDRSTAQSVNNYTNCDRYRLVLNYLQKDSDITKYFEISSNTFDVYSQASSNALPLGMELQYLAGYLNENISAIHLSDKRTKAIFDSLLRKQDNKSKSISEDCLKNQENLNAPVHLEFGGNESFITVNAFTAVKGYNKGLIFLFYFDEKQQIRKVYKKTWVE